VRNSDCIKPQKVRGALHIMSPIPKSGGHVPFVPQSCTRELGRWRDGLLVYVEVELIWTVDIEAGMNFAVCVSVSYRVWRCTRQVAIEMRGLAKFTTIYRYTAISVHQRSEIDCEQYQQR